MLLSNSNPNLVSLSVETIQSKPIMVATHASKGQISQDHIQKSLSNKEFHDKTQNTDTYCFDDFNARNDTERIMKDLIIKNMIPIIKALGIVFFIISSILLLYTFPKFISTLYESEFQKGILIYGLFILFGFIVKMGLTYDLSEVCERIECK